MAYHEPTISSSKVSNNSATCPCCITKSSSEMIMIDCRSFCMLCLLFVFCYLLPVHSPIFPPLENGQCFMQDQKSYRSIMTRRKVIAGKSLWIRMILMLYFLFARQSCSFSNILMVAHIFMARNVRPKCPILRKQCYTVFF